MIWILGKNASMRTFPTEFFTDKTTIGLNEAATIFNTSYAFSGYPFQIKLYLASGLPMERIIGVKPKFEIPGQFGSDYWPNYFPGILNDPVVYDNHTLGKFAEVGAEMQKLVSKDSTFAYHTDGTVAQLAIYWCMLHDKHPISMCGCNQDEHCIECSSCHTGKDGHPAKCPRDTPAWARSRAYTREVIRCLNLHGDYVRFYENYDDYKQKENIP